MPTERLYGSGAFVGRNGGGGSSIADLIMANGQRQAQLLAEGGRQRAELFSGISADLAGGVGAAFQAHQDRKVQGAVRSAAAPGADINAILSGLPPELQGRAMKGISDWNDYTTKRQESDARLKKLTQEIEETKRKHVQDDADKLAMGAHHVESLFDTAQGAVAGINMLYGAAKTDKLTDDRFDGFVSSVNDAWQAAKGNPQNEAMFLDALKQQALPILQGLKQGASASVQEKFKPQTRVLTTKDASGGETQEIVNDVPGVKRTSPAEPAKPGTLEDYVIKKYGRSATPEQIAEARKVYNQSDDRPYRDPVPVVVVTAQGPQIVDRKTGTAKPITDSGGATVGLAPTTDERNRAAATGRAAPVLDSITELSERINTGRGVTAKITGAVERAKAQANLNDDVAEYEAVVQSFTPLLARAMGHTGVLTQQDVDSARAIIPKPEDSKSLRDRKVARIKKLLGGQEQAVEPPAGKSKYKVEVIQ